MRQSFTVKEFTDTPLHPGLRWSEAVAERRPWYVGFIDKGGYFQSCVRRVQRIVEARLGVPPPITEAVLALHEALVVRSE